METEEYAHRKRAGRYQNALVRKHNIIAGKEHRLSRIERQLSGFASRERMERWRAQRHRLKRSLEFHYTGLQRLQDRFLKGDD